MAQYANIIVDISHEKLDKTFQYKIPERMRERLVLGMQVYIPFGNRKVKGYVVELTDEAEYDVTKLKDIIGIVTDSIPIESQLIALAGWMRKNYGGTMNHALKTVIPIKKKMTAVEHKTVRLLLGSIEARNQLAEYERNKRSVARARLLKELIAKQELDWEIVTKKLNVSGTIIRAMEEAGIVAIDTEKSYRNPVERLDSKGYHLVLNDTQQAVVDAVTANIDREIQRTYLLKGVTGSGKTEVYMELIAHVLAQGKQAIVLIPEIALTYQTLLRFYQRFGDRVSVMNSKLSPGERSDQFERASKGEIDIMIGPRSALFTPFTRLGLIIIDEEHEASYKSETMPKYHAREVAQEICRMKSASLLLGSATPSLESYYLAKENKIKLFYLNNRLAGGELPFVHIVDLREELKQGNRSIFSRKLKELLKDRLEKKQQSMLFLNRRGFAGFVSCRACGHVMKCPHCDVSLSEHRNGKLVCHYCGFEMPQVTKCPQCGSKYILGFRAGTQQIEEMLLKEFPKARVLRMDADTTKSKDSYEKILSQFANEEADILVGTQMIVKGHDFPKVTLVGVIAADMSLHVGDYRAAERTFQLLTQAAGRAGRSTLSGEVVIQTYQPDHYAVVHAANQDYEGFYEEEISYRDLMMYPPVANMMAILVLSNDELTGTCHANELADAIKSSFAKERPYVIGPASASIGKINDIYRNVIYIKHRDYHVLVRIKDEMEAMIAEKEWNTDTVQFDFNPMSAY